jgi:hypothetical protein
MEMEMKGLDGDEADAIKMMALHGNNVWYVESTIGYGNDWSTPSYPRNPELCKTAKIFWAEALDKSGTNAPKVDVPMRKVDEEVVN